MGFGDFVARFEIAAQVGKTENLPRSVRSNSLERRGGERKGRAQAKTRRDALLEDFQRDLARRCGDFPHFVMVMGGMAVFVVVRMTVAMMMVVGAAAQQPGAGDIDR